MIHGREKARDVDYLNSAGWARPRSGAWAPDRGAREGRSENLGAGWWWVRWRRRAREISRCAVIVKVINLYLRMKV